ncbi:InlB B-repeat-containing protein, partial [Ruminococcaceae bacterium OttesenSCG-928-A16]|nr:InlB B-repeat-containing protein [Ruminococcaceae bacterium OttesenSCG-928-A16]
MGWPEGSGNRTITPTADGVKISFTVSGGGGDGAGFTIGFPFDKENFYGWLPTGKLMAEITTGGDVAGDNLRTVTADVVDSASLSFAASQTGEISAGQQVALMLDARATYQNSVKWRLEPGTSLQVVLEYPTGAQLTLPASPTYGTGAHTVTTINDTTEAIVWEMGTVDENGFATVPPWGSHYSARRLSYETVKAINLVFPEEGFKKDDTPAVKAYFEYTLAGTDTPVRKEITLNFKITDGYVHMQPLNLAVENYPAILDIDDPLVLGSYAPVTTTAQNGGSLPVPGTCLTWYNDSTGEGHKTNLGEIRLHNIGVRFQSKMVYYIASDPANENEQETVRTVVYYAPAAATAGGYRAITLAAAGVVLAAGEYIDKVEVWPLNNDIAETVTPANEQLALPVSAGIYITTYCYSWEGGKFPNGDDIEQGDWTHLAVGLKWSGESRPDDHTVPEGATIEKNPETGQPATITMRSKDTPKIFYGHHVIATTTTLAYQDGHNGSKTPGQQFDVNLTLTNSATVSRVNDGWVDPIIYYVPPSSIELDVTQPLAVEGKPDATVTAEKIELDGKLAYKFEVKGLAIARSYTYTIPLTLKVKPGTLPGSYALTSYQGSSGLLFGTSATPHSLYYGYTINENNFYKDINDLDNNADFWQGKDYTPYLRTASGPTMVVSLLPKMDVVPELFNNLAQEGTGEWQNVNTNTEAQATVATSATGKGEFRLTIANSGNTYLGNIRLLDILPFVKIEDTLPEGTALNPDEDKGSEWTAVLKNALEVIVYDAEDNDVTSDFSGWSVRYSTNGNPSYNGGDGGIVRIGDADFGAGTTAYVGAKSFLFQSGSFRLPPSYQLVIKGTVAAPAGVTENDAGKVAYNSFAVQAYYYTAATGTAGQAPAGVTQPTKQKFILVDGMDGAIVKSTKSGFVFKDLDHDGKYTEGTDELFEDVEVELWRADADGNPTGLNYVAKTSTDANGQYEFTDLNAGDYVIKVINSGGEAYLFAPQGADGNATLSHVNSAGVGGKFTLKASEQLEAPTNAGIQAASSITVEFREESSTGTLLKTVTVAYNDAEYSAYASPLEMPNGSLTAGTAPFTLPQDYQLQTPEDATQTYQLTWPVPSQTIVFVVEKETYALSYQLNGSTSYPTTPATIATQNVAWDSVITQASSYVAAPTRHGYTFGGWYTADDFAEGSELAASAVMPKAAVTLYAKWVVEEYAITYDYDNGTAPEAANPTSYTVEDLPMDIENEPTRTGYEFKGWTDSNGEVPELTVTLADGDYGDKNYVANWDANDYTLSFDGNGGTGSMADVTVTFDEETTLPANEFEKPGYDFVGWNTSADGTG